MFSGRLTKLIALGAAVIAVAGGTYGIVTATASSGPGTVTTAASPAPTSGRPAFGGRGSNARSGPAAGGAAGTVGSVSGTSFVLTTSAGQKVSVSNAAPVRNGESIVVLGTVDGTTIAAGQVMPQPSATSSAAAVVPFQRGAPSTSKQVGQVPAGYTQGAGTIVSGTTANNATKAALAAYPGGIVDRVVKLAGGEYEVHNIGVNWPHHIFVNQTFEVVGAN
jgi:hypothetical protein